jgi:hypothetical protein
MLQEEYGQLPAYVRSPEILEFDERWMVILGDGRRSFETLCTTSDLSRRVRWNEGILALCSAYNWKYVATVGINNNCVADHWSEMMQSTFLGYIT